MLFRSVIAMTSNHQAVVIGGYDSRKLLIYNPTSGKKQSVSRAEYEKIFEGAGNRFISYMVE